MRVGILPVRSAPVDRQRVGKPLPSGQPLRKPRSQLPPPGRIQFLGKRELDFPVEAPVGPLVLVRRLPIRARIVPGPFRHVPALAVFQFIGVLCVAPFAPDVMALGEGRLPTGAAADAHF